MCLVLTLLAVGDIAGGKISGIENTAVESMQKWNTEKNECKKTKRKEYQWAVWQLQVSVSSQQCPWF